MSRIGKQPVAVPATPDAAPAPKVNTAVVEALQKLAEDNDAAFAEADKQLDAAHVPDPAVDAQEWAALSLVNAVWAQALAEDADAAPKDKAAEPRAEAERRLVRAEKFAKEAFDRAPTAPETLLAQAEVLRQKKILTAEVEKKLAGAGDSSEAIYSKATKPEGGGPGAGPAGDGGQEKKPKDDVVEAEFEEVKE